MKKGWLIFFWFLVIMIVSIVLIFLEAKGRTSNIIQTVAIITLVFITWFYAKQTKKLVEEQKLERDLRFNERRLHSFYNPYILSLDELKENLSELDMSKLERKIVNYEAETTEVEFGKKINLAKSLFDHSYQSIFYKYSYMVSQETAKIIKKYFLELGVCSNKEMNKELKNEDQDKLFELLIELRTRLHEERTKIEDYISANYPFAEKGIKKK